MQAWKTGALDMWLHQQLAARFDPTLDETLPVEFTRLLGGPALGLKRAEPGRHARHRSSVRARAGQGR